MAIFFYLIELPESSLSREDPGNKLVQSACSARWCVRLRHKSHCFWHFALISHAYENTHLALRLPYYTVYVCFFVFFHVKTDKQLEKYHIINMAIQNWSKYKMHLRTDFQPHGFDVGPLHTCSQRLGEEWPNNWSVSSHDGQNSKSVVLVYLIFC